MPDDYYKILGLCCFIKDALISFYEAEVSGQYQYQLRDRHLARYIDSINAEQFSYQHRLQPIERDNIDPILLYARSLLIQFNRAIHYSNLNIYQNLQNGNVWIDITQFHPHGPSYEPTELNPSWWRFDEKNEPSIIEIKKSEFAPTSQKIIRPIAVCKTK